MYLSELKKSKIYFRVKRMEGGAGVGGETGEDTEKMWKYQWTMSPLLRLVLVTFEPTFPNM